MAERLAERHRKCLLSERKALELEAVADRLRGENRILKRWCNMMENVIREVIDLGTSPHANWRSGLFAFSAFLPANSSLSRLTRRSMWTS